MEDIKYNKVDSSNIVGQLYKKKEKKLYIKFKNERQYVYPDVSQEEFDALQEAESFGKEFYATIVKNKKFEEIW